MELKFGEEEKSFWDKLRGVGGPYYDPWTRLKDDRALAKKLAGGLLGFQAPLALSGMFKAQDYLHPNRPFYGPEKKEDPQETRDDYPAIERERKRLYALATRLNRPADWARLRAFSQYG